MSVPVSVVGAMICYDRGFPESARILMLKGAELILVPNASDLGDSVVDGQKTTFEISFGLSRLPLIIR